MLPPELEVHYQTELKVRVHWSRKKTKDKYLVALHQIAMVHFSVLALMQDFRTLPDQLYKKRTPSRSSKRRWENAALAKNIINRATG
jgi:uncharacterized protein (DUF2132 family)